MNKNLPKLKVSPKALVFITLILIAVTFGLLQLGESLGWQVKGIDQSRQLAKTIGSIPTTPTDNGDGDCDEGETGSDDCECDDGSTVAEGESCEEDEPDCPIGSTTCDVDDENHSCLAGQVWNGLGCESVCGSGQIWDGTRCVDLTPTCPAGTNRVGNVCLINDCNISGSYPCISPTPLIQYRSYNPMSGQTVDAWASSDTGWRTGNISGTLFAPYQVKWDATEILAFRERYQNVGHERLYTYTSEFSNCGLEVSRNGTITVLATGRAGTYTGIMTMDQWLGGGNHGRFEVVCNNRVTRYFNTEVLGTETQRGNYYQSNTGTATGDIIYYIYPTRQSVNGLPATQCEVPFNQIVSSLNSGAITKITEKSFRDWAKTDKFDDCDYNIDGTCKKQNPAGYENRELIKRSGAVDDIKTAMAVGQCARWNVDYDSQIWELIAHADNVLSEIKIINDANQPTLFSVLIFTGELSEDNIRGGHAVVALDTKITDNDPLTYEIKVLDPEGPEIHNIVCQQEKIGRFQNRETFVCLEEDFIAPKMIPISISLPINISTLRNTYISNCPAGSEITKPGLCGRRADLSAWLENNYPNITNFGSEESPQGVCYGWTDFVLKTTYLGNFAGECPHPISISL